MIATREMDVEYGAENREEFESLFLRSHKRIYNLAFRMLGNAGEAEDVTQDAFVRAWQNFHHYDRARPFEGWIYRIVTNLVIDRRRRQKRVPMYSLDAPLTGESLDAPIAFEFADTSDDPATRLMADQFDETLQTALAALPADYRTAVLLADVEERSYQEIADTMNCAIGTVRSRIHRARIMLRRSMENNASHRRPVLGKVRAAACTA